MYRWLAGMYADEPGYRHIIFRPTPVGDLTWASYRTETPGGNASISWKLRRSGGIIINVEVPEGSAATLICPDGEKRELGPGRHVVKK